MAVDFDPALVSWAKSPRNLWGIARHISAGPVSAIRRVRSRVERGSPRQESFPEPSLISQTGFKTRHNLTSQGWGYVDEFFSIETYQHLLKHWPRLCDFKGPGGDWTKSYDTSTIGMSRNSYSESARPDGFVSSIFHLLFSDQTARLVTALANDGVPRVAMNASLSWARHHHYLLPHRDSNSEDNRRWINFIIFVDGETPALESGGTSFFRTNSFEDVLFSPHSLKNTAIFYDTRAGFYHGFPPVRWGRFSKRIICNYATNTEIQS